MVLRDDAASVLYLTITRAVAAPLGGPATRAAALIWASGAPDDHGASKAAPTRPRVRRDLRIEASPGFRVGCKDTGEGDGPIRALRAADGRRAAKSTAVGHSHAGADQCIDAIASALVGTGVLHTPAAQQRFFTVGTHGGF